MSDDQNLKVPAGKGCAAHIRFTKEEYTRLVRDSALTGKSIPWLLKTVFFKGGISAPLFDAETRREMRRLFGQMGNDLNSIGRAAHKQGWADVAEEVRQTIDVLRKMKKDFLCDYGDR